MPRKRPSQGANHGDDPPGQVERRPPLRKDEAIASLPHAGDASAFAAFLDRHPAFIKHMLSSDDPGMARSAVPFLIDYLRERGRALPVLAMLADWFDPKATGTAWKLTLKRRRRGSRPSSDRRLMKDAELTDEVNELTAALRAAGKRSPRKQAITEVAKRRRLKPKGVEAAMTRTAKALRK
jgi:hypothetical protein